MNLGGLSKCVKHTKRPSALAYEKLNIHVRGVWNDVKSNLKHTPKENVKNEFIVDM